MDFFERQNQARRSTAVLVLAFVVAILLVAIAVDAVVWGTLRVLDRTSLDFLAWLATPRAWIITAVLLVSILATSAWRSAQLYKGGGGRVALLLGGRIVDPDTKDEDESRLINVVEEMAIAAGITVPDVYVLENEDAINAFAAGDSPANAVIAVTRGLLERLDRDALQGVIAHEFSHILNGDMRLNIRMIGLLAGMTMISQIGTKPWRAMAMGRHRGHHSRSMFLGTRGRGGQAYLAILVAGLIVAAIGWIGVLGGRVIKAAVSRQREFLADAAAVQFTRNPDGLAHALLEIHEASGGGSRLRNHHAEEVSHMGFGRTVSGITGLTATHPPIKDRMAALGPKYEYWYRDGERIRRREQREAEAEEEAARKDEQRAAATSASEGAVLAGLGGADAVSAGLSAATLAGIAGSLDGGSVQRAHELLRRLPEEILQAVHTPNGAEDAVSALLLHGPDTRERDLGVLPEARREQVGRLRLALECNWPGKTADRLDPRVRLPLLELALRSLRKLEPEARASFLKRLDAQIRVNGRISMFEYAARTLLRRELDTERVSRYGTAKLKRHRGEAAIVLSLLAHAGGGDRQQRATAYARGVEGLPGGLADTELLQPSECSPKLVTRALTVLEAVQPGDKRALLEACTRTISADDHIRASEAELLRMFAALVDTPVPAIFADPD
ncbi:M48 family metallopeptidase [Halofilum ochraceum]|uniref:M48 family metallopeptidase n=1 Tax=Halofilum ochraceum TaxID=1611323 RepID=UPI00082B0930|nr:M48 family metallopeptidase [Halofilum ochraceum]